MGENRTTRRARYTKPRKLTQWRERMGYSRRDAVTAMGCSPQEWDMWEDGVVKIPRHIGLALDALALGIGEDEPEGND